MSTALARRARPRREARRDLTVVRRRRGALIRRSPARRAAPLMALSCLVLVVAVAVVLIEQVFMAQSAFRLNEMRQRLEAAQLRHEELLLEAARLEDPDRILAYARDRLGMVEPRGSDVRYLVADIVLETGTRLAGADTRPARPIRGRGAFAEVGP